METNQTNLLRDTKTIKIEDEIRSFIPIIVKFKSYENKVKTMKEKTKG